MIIIERGTYCFIVFGGYIFKRKPPLFAAASAVAFVASSAAFFCYMIGLVPRLLRVLLRLCLFFNMIFGVSQPNKLVGKGPCFSVFLVPV